MFNSGFLSEQKCTKVKTLVFWVVLCLENQDNVSGLLLNCLVPWAVGLTII